MSLVFAAVTPSLRKGPETEVFGGWMSTKPPSPPLPEQQPWRGSWEKELNRWLGGPEQPAVVLGSSQTYV